MLPKQEIENWTWVFGSELVSFVIHVYHIFGLLCVFFGVIYTPWQMIVVSAVCL